MRKDKDIRVVGVNYGQIPDNDSYRKYPFPKEVQIGGWPKVLRVCSHYAYDNKGVYRNHKLLLDVCDIRQGTDEYDLPVWWIWCRDIIDIPSFDM